MPATQPLPQTWTLRFKNHRTTILLHVDPLHTLTSIKIELLKAIQQTNPSGKLNGLEIPQDAHEILLARAVDINDLSRGWENLDPGKDDVADSEAGTGKGKAKVKASVSGKGKAAEGSKGKDCAQGAGLRDGGVVAFKFRRKQDEAQKTESMREKDGDEGIEVDDEGEGREEWDVLVPSVEETYGEQAQEVPEIRKAEGI